MNDDLISRSALRKAVNDFYDNSFKGIVSSDLIKYAEAVDDFIDNAPTVDTTFREVVAYECGQKSVGKWIPVSERLPEVRIDSTTNDFEEVLCSTKFGKVRTYKYGKPIGHTEAHFWYGWGIMDNAIIAWQPLPEPYKADMRGDV